METSVFIARIAGPYFLVVALGALMNLRIYRQLIEKFIDDPVLLYIRGAVAFIFGLVVLQYHNIWTLHWGIIITVLAWGAVVKGVYLIVFPSAAAKAIRFYKEYPIFLVFILVSALIFGILLTIFGYFIEPQAFADLNDVR